jgi:catechol 2,3-dioxygenase-like lactoylglutathione lyase family enzyme
MLGKADAMPMIAVKDIDRARKFYEGKLGLETKDAMGGEVLEVKSGDTVINVYRSEHAGTNQATALTFAVDDIEAEVRDLKDKGIFFEQYDMPGLEKRGDLYVAEGMKTTWFKDPDGNILSLFVGLFLLGRRPGWGTIERRFDGGGVTDARASCPLPAALVPLPTSFARREELRLPGSRCRSRGAHIRAPVPARPGPGKRKAQASWLDANSR